MEKRLPGAAVREFDDHLGGAVPHTTFGGRMSRLFVTTESLSDAACGVVVPSMKGHERRMEDMVSERMLSAGFRSAVSDRRHGVLGEREFRIGHSEGALVPTFHIIAQSDPVTLKRALLGHDVRRPARQAALEPA